MEPNQFPAQTPQPAEGYQTVPTSTTNGMAVAGLILAFIIPLIGLILSIIGLNKAKNHNGNGRGLAIAGIVVSSIMIILSILILPALLITTMSSIQKKAKEAEQASTSSTKISTAESTKLGSVYNEKSGAYSIQFPEGWKINQAEASRDTSAIPVGTDDYVSTAYVAVDKLFQGETLETFVASEIDNIKKYKGGTIKSEGAVTINGIKGYEIVANEDTVQRVTSSYNVLLVKGEVIYRLSYDTSPERSEKNLPLFKSSAQSFVIKQ